jgi:hypothetical protein
VKAAHAGLLVLMLNTGCLRFGYDIPRKHELPDASPFDAGTQIDAAVVDAGRMPDAAVSDAASSAGQGAAGQSTGGQSAAGSTGQAGSGGTGGAADGGGSATPPVDAGVEPDAAADSGNPEQEPLGGTGLVVGDILGFYDGDWGKMVLRRYDAEIWGVYEHSNGTIVGKIMSDGVFTGWWTQAPSREGSSAGEVEFYWEQISGAVIMLNGRWRYGTSGTWYDNWDVHLVTDNEPPSSLIAGFDNPEDFKRHP